MFPLNRIVSWGGSLTALKDVPCNNRPAAAGATSAPITTCIHELSYLNNISDLKSSVVADTSLVNSRFHYYNEEKDDIKQQELDPIEHWIKSIKPGEGSLPIHYAAYSGAKESVITLLNNKSEVNIQNSIGLSPLHLVCLCSNASTSTSVFFDVMKIIVEHGAELDVSDIYGFTPLHFAITYSTHDMILYLLDTFQFKQKERLNENNILNKKGYGGLTLCHLICRRHFSQGLNKLIQMGCDINILDCSLASPLLHLVASRRFSKQNHKFEDDENDVEESKACLKYLIESGCDLKCKDVDGYNIYHYIAISGSHYLLPILESTITQDLIHSKDSLGNQPIHLAASSGHLEVVQYLYSKMDQSSNQPTVALNGFNIFHKACFSGNLDTIQYILNQNTDVFYNSRTIPGGWSALHIVNQIGSVSTQSFLFSLNDANDNIELQLNIRDGEGDTPLHKSCYYGHKSSVTSLVEYYDKKVRKGRKTKTSKSNNNSDSNDEDICNEANNRGETLLHKLFQGLNFMLLSESKQYLIQNEMNQISTFSQGTIIDYVDIINYLLARTNIDLNQCDSMHRNVLHWACSYYSLQANPLPHHIQILRGFILSLIQKGADVDGVDALGCTPLHYICFAQFYHSNLPRNPKVKIATTASPVFAFASDNYNKDEVVMKLIGEEKSNLNKVNNKQQTPLHIAIKTNSAVIAKQLIYAGADHKIKDHKHRTVLDLPNSFTLNLVEQWLYDRDHPIGERVDVTKLNDTQKQLFVEGVSKFNAAGISGATTKPWAGIEFLIQRGILKPTIESVSWFCFHFRELNQLSVGEFLSEREDLMADKLAATGLQCTVTAIRERYVEYYNFEDLEFDMCIRRFLYHFKLPAEAQKIERWISTFADLFHLSKSASVNVFENSQAVFYTTYSVIMLNTDLHSPLVTKKMTKEQFINQIHVLGIDSQADKIPEEFLSEIYGKIKDNPIKIGSVANLTNSRSPSITLSPSSAANNLSEIWMNPDKEGWVEKQNGQKLWYKRWLVLKDANVFYFDKPFDIFKQQTSANGWVPTGMYPLQSTKITLDVNTSRGKRKYCMILQDEAGLGKLKECRFTNRRELEKNSVERSKCSSVKISVASRKEINSWFYMMIRNKECATGQDDNQDIKRDKEQDQNKEKDEDKEEQKEKEKKKVEEEAEVKELVVRRGKSLEVDSSKENAHNKDSPILANSQRPKKKKTQASERNMITSTSFFSSSGFEPPKLVKAKSALNTITTASTTTATTTVPNPIKSSTPLPNSPNFSQHGISVKLNSDVAVNSVKLLIQKPLKPNERGSRGVMFSSPESRNLPSTRALPSTFIKEAPAPLNPRNNIINKKSTTSNQTTSKRKMEENLREN